MSGKVPTRLYGAKVWIGTDESKNIARIKNYDGVEKLLPNSTDNKAGFIADTELPTAVDYDALNNVQFGRLSGLAEPGSITQIPDGTHTANNPDDVPFADSIGNGLVNKGVSNATDFYFARGNNPTSLEQMNALNSNILTYHGQALTYGVDNGYHGPQEAPESGAATASGGLVPNSIGKPKAGGERQGTIDLAWRQRQLRGRQFRPG